MADKKESEALTRETQTDNFPTYQDEKALTAADAGKGPTNKDGDANHVDLASLDHGEESPVAKAERKAAEDNPYSPVPAQMLPENQDDSVKPGK